MVNPGADGPVHVFIANHEIDDLGSQFRLGHLIDPADDQAIVYERALQGLQDALEIGLRQGGVADAGDQLAASASRTATALGAISPAMLSPVTQRELNRVLASVEQSLLVPEGLVGRPWYKHSIFAPGSYAGYAAEVMPGVNEALDRNDPATFHREANALAAALARAAVRLDEVSGMAKTAAGAHSGQ